MAAHETILAVERPGSKKAKRGAAGITTATPRLFAG
jgi:hypothetical protein